jgi:hypothetical protein
MSRFTGYIRHRDITYDLAEHEVLLSFDNDKGAAAFDEWWESQGANVFGYWCERNPNPEYRDMVKE